MFVEKIMTADPVTVEQDTTVGELAKIFDSHDIHHLIVTTTLKNQGHHVLGVISDRDVLRCLSPFANTAAETRRDSFTLNKKAHQIMTRKPITVSTDTPVKLAAELMLHNKISSLPVLRTSNELAGILTWRDLLKFAVSRTSD